jgi:signal transduction histidine kinase
VTADEWVLSVTDAGGGAPPATAADRPGGERTRLGLRAMQRAADRVHGHVERLSASDAGGFVVRVTVPTGSDR